MSLQLPSIPVVDAPWSANVSEGRLLPERAWRLPYSEVAEWAPEGLPFELLIRMTPYQAWDYLSMNGVLAEPTRRLLTQILPPLEHCHERGVPHLDLPEDYGKTDLSDAEMFPPAVSSPAPDYHPIDVVADAEEEEEDAPAAPLVGIHPNPGPVDKRREKKDAAKALKRAKERKRDLGRRRARARKEQTVAFLQSGGEINPGPWRGQGKVGKDRSKANSLAGPVLVAAPKMSTKLKITRPTPAPAPAPPPATSPTSEGSKTELDRPDVRTRQEYVDGGIECRLDGAKVADKDTAVRKIGPRRVSICRHCNVVLHDGVHPSMLAASLLAAEMDAPGHADSPSRSPSPATGSEAGTPPASPPPPSPPPPAVAETGAVEPAETRASPAPAAEEVPSMPAAAAAEAVDSGAYRAAFAREQQERFDQAATSYRAIPKPVSLLKWLGWILVCWTRVTGCGFGVVKRLLFLICCGSHPTEGISCLRRVQTVEAYRARQTRLLRRLFPVDMARSSRTAAPVVWRHWKRAPTVAPLVPCVMTLLPDPKIEPPGERSVKDIMAGLNKEGQGTYMTHGLMVLSGYGSDAPDYSRPLRLGPDDAAAQAEVVKKHKRPRVLDGYRLNDSQIADLVASIGGDPCTASSYTRIEHYDDTIGDRRLRSLVNVVESKFDYWETNITGHRHTLTAWSWALLCTAVVIAADYTYKHLKADLTIFSVGVAVLRCAVLVAWLSMLRARSRYASVCFRALVGVTVFAWGDDFLFGIAQLSASAVWFSVLVLPFIYGLVRPRYMMAMAVVLATVGTAWYASYPIVTYFVFFALRFGWVFIPGHWMSWSTRVFYAEKAIRVRVMPHLVTAALSEFSTGAQLTLVAQTTRSKLLRLATLPVPDFLYAQVLTGSECAVKIVAASDSFFDDQMDLRT